MLSGLAAAFGIDPDVAFAKLPKKQRDIVLFGAPGRRATASKKGPPLDPFGADFEGAVPNLRYKRDGSPSFEVHSVLPTLRVTPDGDILKQLVISVTQRLRKVQR